MRDQVIVNHDMSRRAVLFDGCDVFRARCWARRCLLQVVFVFAGVAAFGAGAAESHAASLPDNRAYELVTQMNNGNNAPFARLGSTGGDEMSADGNAVSFFIAESLPGSQSYGSQARAVRTSGGWTDANVIPPQSIATALECSIDPTVVDYSSDMSKGVLEDGFNSLSGCPVDDPRLVPGEPQGVQNIFVSDLAKGTYQLVDVTPSGVTPANADYLGGSSDLSHVVFEEAAQLTSDAPSLVAFDATNLYEWVGGTVSLVTEVPTSPATSCSGAACAPAVGVLASESSPINPAPLQSHAVSEDGSRVYFTANGNLYVRQNGTSTVQVDAPAAGGAGAGGGGQFQSASADGSKVFLTDDASAGLTADTVSGSGNNLYEYDVSTGQLTDLTPSPDAEVQGFSAMSDDGSFIYFVADGSLASGATAGQPNLYVSHGGTTTLIATLNPSDAADWSRLAPTARASSNGQFFVFTSVASLTGFNNMDAVTSGKTDSEIFFYDATSGALRCVSCSPTGAAPTGDTIVNGGQVVGLHSSMVVMDARYVATSGQVFFDTPNALTPSDTDGVSDAYEYEAGRVSLISSGTDTAGALYLDNARDGSNVLFATSTPLVSQDTDGSAYDIYDARVGGGFPAVPSPTPPCQGDSCRPPQSNQPLESLPGSSTFTGPANAESSQVAARITLVKRTFKRSGFGLRLRVTGSGKVVVSGASIKRASRSVAGAGTYTVFVELTNKAKKRLKHKRRLNLSVRAQYVPSAGRASAVRVNLTAKA